jgi:glutamine---fructose-6-phosphate transaminase (isomerizing)
MLREALQAPQVAAAQLRGNQAHMSELAAAYRANPPLALLTIGRGSSDHAASHAAYWAMALLRIPVASLPMSLVSLYQAPTPSPQIWALAFSQSGQSTDLVGALRFFAQGGAPTVAFVNAADSPLAQTASWPVPLHAGPELSVAATKSFIGQLVAGMDWIGHCAADQALLQGLAKLPQALEAAAQADWSPAVAALQGVNQLYVLGRGAGLSIALEVALKFKEVCGMQAEAFSSAEVQHGPMALIERGYTVLVLALPGPACAGVLEVATKFRERGAHVVLAAPVGTPHMDLPLVCTEHLALNAITCVQSFYPMVEALARARGLNPDVPRHLNKVTFTV